MAKEFIESLNLDKLLGHGGFGEVFLATTDDGDKYAVKALNKERSNIASVENEINAGILLNHPNVVKYHTHFHDEENYYVVFDFVSGSDLFTYISERSFEPLSEEETRNIMKQLIDAVAYCHQQEVVHMDIKLDNIMYNADTKKVTLLDFGLADFIVEGDDYLTKRVGSYEYTAPELLKSKTTPFSSTKVDIWTLGVVMFALLTARFPLTEKNRHQIIKDCEWTPYFGDQDPSFEARDLVSKMLHPNPRCRASITEIVNHPFFL